MPETGSTKPLKPAQEAAKPQGKGKGATTPANAPKAPKKCGQRRGSEKMRRVVLDF